MVGEYWPDEMWETDRDGWDDAGLKDVVELARSSNSTDICVVHRGRIVVDEWWEPTETNRQVVIETLPDGRVRQDVASVQKSIVSILTGIAVARGVLDLDELVDDHLGAGWAGPDASPTASQVTMRQLISMTSGLGDDGSLLFEPGTAWDYNLGAAYHSTKRVLAAAAGQSIDDLTAEWLTGPVGMTETTWTQRKWVEGTPEIFRHVFQYPDGEPMEALCSTSRDLARLGLAVLRGCRWDDALLGVDPDYVTAMAQPSQPFNPAYGYLWWRNTNESFFAPKNPTPLDGPYLPGVPLDAFAALGAMDRICTIVPSLDLVIARTGGPAAGGAAAATRFTAEFCRAVCAAHPEATRG